MARVLRNDGETIDVRETDLAELETPDQDAVYTLRVWTQEKYRELATKNTEYIIDRRSHQRVPRINDQALADDLLDWVIADWQGIVDGAGQPVACIREHKLKLDGLIRAALNVRAGINEVTRSPEERKAESFRQPPAVP